MEVRALRAYAEVALGRQRSPQHDQGPHMVRYLRAANVKDGYLELDDVKEMNFEPGEQKTFSLAPGDVLMTEGSGSLRAVGASAIWNGELSGTVCFQNTLLRLRPRLSTDPRYLAWWCRHAFADGTLASVANGANIFHVSAERVRSLPVTYIEPHGQRAIADFLDTETTRIDALIAKKRRMIDLATERANQFASAAVTFGLQPDRPLLPTGNQFAPVVPAAWTLHRLRHLAAEIVDTAHKTAPVVDDGDYLVVRTANVKAGRLSLMNALFTDHAGWVDWTERGVPEVGDVMFTREAPAGEACTVPPGRNLCIGQRMVLVRPDPAKVSGDWLVRSIYAGPAQQFIKLLSKSTTVAHLNMSDISDIPIALPSLDEQAEILKVLSRVIDRQQAIVDSLSRQIELLVEHRQALITAAVTGELAVPELAG